MAPYAEQLLVCTGQSDWPSKVEDDHGGENLVADVKELIGRGGEFADVGFDFFLLSRRFSSFLGIWQGHRLWLKEDMECD